VPSASDSDFILQASLSKPALTNRERLIRGRETLGAPPAQRFSARMSSLGDPEVEIWKNRVFCMLC